MASTGRASVTIDLFTAGTSFAGGAAFFGVKLRRTNSGRLRPRPVRVKVRIDERQIGIRRYLRLRVPSRGEGGGTRLGAARYVSGVDRINVRGRDINREAKERD